MSHKINVMRHEINLVDCEIGFVGGNWSWSFPFLPTLLPPHVLPFLPHPVLEIEPEFDPQWEEEEKLHKQVR